MDKIEKLLKKLTKSEKRIIADCIKSILNKDLADIDIKKLKGSTNIYRARKGRMRIIYILKKDDIQIIAIERRSEKTYRNY